MRDEEARDERARARAEERAWRDIVHHYGERPELPLELTDQESFEEAAYGPFPADVPDPHDESFTPPPLPPPAQVSPERRAAWVVLVVSPVLLVVLNLVDYSLPGILSGGLVVAFIASFGYLVATMTPRDPDDDGARV
jgi:hypothetical protein